jgi:predicted DNA-binding protein
MATTKIQTGLRIDEPTWEKLSILSKREGRSLNNMIEYIIRRYLEDYENAHGSIAPQIEGQLSVQDL